MVEVVMTDTRWVFVAFVINLPAHRVGDAFAVFENQVRCRSLNTCKPISLTAARRIDAPRLLDWVRRYG
jgi:hypothetical protein